MAVQPYESWKVYIGFTRDPNDRTLPLTDVTSRVDGAILITEGRLTHVDVVGWSEVQMNLRNEDQALTPGNPFSPYAPFVLSGRRIVVTDVAGEQEFNLFDGFIQFPEAQDWAKSDATVPRSQTITVTGIDRMGRLDNARSFLSTLGEHIRYNGGSALKVHYPMSEAASPFIDVATGGAPLNAAVIDDDPVFTLPTTGLAQLLPQQGEPIRGDDISPMRCEHSYETDGANVFISRYVRGYATWPAGRIPLPSGQVLTLCFWVRPGYGKFTGGHGVGPVRLELNTGDPTDFTTFNVSTLDGFSVELSSGSFTGYSCVITGGGWLQDQWIPIAVQYTPSGPTVEMWVSGNRHIGAPTGTPPATNSVTALYAPYTFFQGDLTGVQVYIGDANAFTYADFLAQVAMGWQGLDRQRVDERITTLAQYAGLTTDDLELDRGSGAMAPARLAGQKPGPLIRSAAATDNGLVYTREGRITFHGRQRRYNPLLAGTVDLTWLEQPLQFRTDPPLNVMDVTSPSGFTGHAVNTDSTGEWTENAGTVDLDTVCDADPSNLAAFTVREFARPRYRAPVLAFELRSTTDVTRRRAIIGAQLSQRWALSGLPDNAPDGTNTFHIEGIRRVVSLAGHRVEWNTGPVFGDVPGVVQPYPLVGTEGAGLGGGQDSFSRSVSNGWGTADSGQTWSIVGGTAADFAVDGVRGTMTHSAVSATHSISLPFGIVDMDARIDADHNIGSVAGGNLVSFFDFRMVDTSNLYRLTVRWKPAGTATAELVRVLAGTPTTIAAETAIPGATSTSSLTIRVRASGIVASGVTVQAKAWPVAGSEPGSWLLSATDFTIDSPGDFRAASFRDTGNTNNPTVFRFDNLTVTRIVPGGPLISNETVIPF